VFSEVELLYLSESEFESRDTFSFCSVSHWKGLSVWKVLSIRLAKADLDDAGHVVYRLVNKWFNIVLLLLNVDPYDFHLLSILSISGLFVYQRHVRSFLHKFNVTQDE